MDGVSAFVTGMWQVFTGLAAGVAGIIAMSVSLVLYFSVKPVRLFVPVLAVIGTILLFIAISVFGLTGFIGGSAGGIVIGIISLVLTALIIFYDIIVIRKFIVQKKNKPTEEQR